MWRRSQTNCNDLRVPTVFSRVVCGRLMNCSNNYYYRYMTYFCASLSLARSLFRTNTNKRNIIADNLWNSACLICNQPVVILARRRLCFRIGLCVCPCVSVCVCAQNRPISKSLNEVLGPCGFFGGMGCGSGIFKRILYLLLRFL